MLIYNLNCELIAVYSLALCQKGIGYVRIAQACSFAACRFGSGRHFSGKHNLNKYEILPQKCLREKTQ